MSDLEKKDGTEEWNEMIEKMKNEKDGESSFLPLTVFITSVLILIAGFFAHFYTGDTQSRGIQLIGSLAAVKAKWIGICLAAFSVPLFFASRTPYQKRSGRSAQTFIVVGLIAAAGFALLVNSTVQILNYKKDTSPAVVSQAVVKYAGYTTGKPGHFSMDIIPEGYDDFFTVRVSKDIFIAKGKAETIPVYLHSGFFGGKWLSLTE